MWTFLVVAVLLLIGSVLLGFQLACHRLPRLERPLAGRSPGPMLVCIGVYAASFVASIVLAWSTFGWLAGLSTLVIGFWVLPQLFASWWLKRFGYQ